MLTLRGAVMTIFVIGVLGLAGCSDESPPRSVTATAAASASPARTITPPGISALPPEVANVANVILAGDVAAFNALIEELPEPCAANPQGVGSSPKCPPGVPDGGTINTFRYMNCERGYPGDQQREAIANLFSWPNRRFYAAYRPGPAGLPFQLSPAGEYSLIFISDARDGLPIASRFEVRGGRVVLMWTACGPGWDVVSRMTADATAFVAGPAFALPTPTPVPPTPAAGPDGYPLGRRTGLRPGPDIVLGALETANPLLIMAHFHFIGIGCITAPTGFPQPPFCEPGQPAGTNVQVFPVMQTEGTYQTRDQALATAAQLAQPGVRIWAIYRQGAPGAGPYSPAPEGSTVIVLNTAGKVAIALVTDGGNIESVWFTGRSAPEAVAGVPASWYILPPPR